MTRRIRAAVVVAAALMAPVSIGAQTPLHLLREALPGESSPTLLTYDLDARRLLASESLVNATGSGRLYVTPDGRSKLWIATGPRDNQGWVRLTIRDLTTGATTNLPFDVSAAFAINPRRPELYLYDQNGAFALSYAGVRRYAMPSCGQLTSVVTSADGSRVRYECSTSGAVIDATSGVPLLTLPTGLADVGLPGTFSKPGSQLSVDGRSLFVAVAAGYGPTSDGTMLLRRFSVATGEILGEVDTGGNVFSPSSMIVDPRTGRIMGNIGRQAGVFDSISLQLVVEHSWFLFEGGSWQFDPYRARAFVSSSRLVEPGVPTYELYLVDPQSLDTLEWFPGAYLPGSGARFSASFAPLPAVPEVLTASVGGANVQLTWMAGASNAETTRHVLEVGSAPGSSDIYAALEIAPQTVFGASNVPPGRYYVRVRAGNFTGLSAPSNEVIVQVP